MDAEELLQKIDNDLLSQQIRWLEDLATAGNEDDACADGILNLLYSIAEVKFARGL